MNDVKYIRSSFNLLNVYDFSCISILLKNNVKIFGSFLNNVIFNRETIYKFLDNGGIIRGWCFRTYKDIIERDLYEHIVTTRDVERGDFTSSYYTLNIGGITFQIKITYIDDYGQQINKKTLVVNSGIYLDCELLQLDRNGLGLIYIPVIYKNCPNPFYRICRNIERKHMKIISEGVNVTNATVMDLYSYVNNGWITNTTVKKIGVDEIVEPKCSSCGKEIFDEGYQLPCNHMYHLECWRDEFEFSKRLTEMVECCACDYKDFAWRLLR